LDYSELAALIPRSLVLLRRLSHGDYEVGEEGGRKKGEGEREGQREGGREEGRREREGGREGQREGGREGQREGGEEEEAQKFFGTRKNPNPVTHSFSIFLLLAVSWASFPSRLHTYLQRVLAVCTDEWGQEG